MMCSFNVFIPGISDFLIWASHFMIRFKRNFPLNSHSPERIRCVWNSQKVTLRINWVQSTSKIGSSCSQHKYKLYIFISWNNSSIMSIIFRPSHTCLIGNSQLGNMSLNSCIQYAVNHAVDVYSRYILYFVTQTL